jgi:hypothetical protein
MASIAKNRANPDKNVMIARNGEFKNVGINISNTESVIITAAVSPEVNASCGFPIVGKQKINNAPMHVDNPASRDNASGTKEYDRIPSIPSMHNNNTIRGVDMQFMKLLQISVSIYKLQLQLLKKLLYSKNVL